MIEEEGSGVVVALHAAAPGSLSRSIDLRAGKPVEVGDAVRGYGTGAQILAALGIHDMILLSNTPPFAGRPVRLRPGDRRGAPDRGGGLAMSTILLVEARFYPHLNDMLLDGARARDRSGRPQARDADRPRRARDSRRDRARRAQRPLLRLRRARRRDPRRDLSFRSGLERKRARAHGPDAAGLCHRQRHPHRRERGAGDRPLRPAASSTRAAARPGPRSRCSSCARNTRPELVSRA